MQYLSDYLTLAGWKRDWQQTREDVSRFYKSSAELSDRLVATQRDGSIIVGSLYAIMGFSLAVGGAAMDDELLALAGTIACIVGTTKIHNEMK